MEPRRWEVSLAGGLLATVDGLHFLPSGRCNCVRPGSTGSGAAAAAQLPPLTAVASPADRRSFPRWLPGGGYGAAGWWRIQRALLAPLPTAAPRRAHLNRVAHSPKSNRVRCEGRTGRQAARCCVPSAALQVAQSRRCCLQLARIRRQWRREVTLLCFCLPSTRYSGDRSSQLA